MPEFLNNSSTQFLISSIIAILAIVAGFVVYLLQKSKKALSFRIDYIVPILRDFDSNVFLKHDFKLFHKDREIKNASFISITILNTGNQPIITNDFEKPLQVVFSPDSIILEAIIQDTTPLDLSVSLIKLENSITIEPLLLNKNDKFVLNCVVSTESRSLEVTGRVAGVTSIQKYKYSSLLKIQVSVMIYGLLMIGWLFLTSIYSEIRLFTLYGFPIAFILWIFLSGLVLIKSPRDKY